MADLSKIKVNGSIYNLKDTEGRQLVADLTAALKTAAYKDVADSISDGDGKIADAATVKAYVDAQVGVIHNFDVQVYPTLPEASADTQFILALVANDKAIGTYVEYITVKTTTDDTDNYTWEQIGSTEIDLTGYVQKTTTIAGVDLADDITDKEMKTALDLKAMSHADTAKIESYTPVGNVASVIGGTFHPGTLPSYKSATYVAPAVNEQTSEFASEGVVASIDDTDTEMLVFTDATKADALTSTQFTAGSFTDGTFYAGELPDTSHMQVNSVFSGIASTDIPVVPVTV